MTMLFILLCCYISLYYIRPFEWVASLMGAPILFVMGAISLLMLLMAWVGRSIRIFRFKTDIMVGGFVVAIVLSHLSHGYFGGVVESLSKFLPSLVGYFLLVHSLNSAKKLERFILLLISLSTFLAYEAFKQSTDGFTDGGMQPLIEYHLIDGARVALTRVRWFGMFHDPNDLGLALVLPVPFLIDRILGRKYLLAALCLPLLLYGLYLTNSRGAMLAVGSATFTYFVVRFRSVRGAAVGLILMAALIVLGPSRMSQISGGDASAHGRVDAWHAGFQMFKSSPLFGVGKGMFTDYNRLTAHNSYMLVLAELGMFGSFFFLGMFFYPLNWAKENLFRPTAEGEEERNRGLMAAAFASLVGLMTAMFFLSRSYVLLPFMIVGLLTALINKEPQESEMPFPDRVSAGFHWAGIGGLVLGQILVINVIVKILL